MTSRSDQVRERRALLVGAVLLVAAGVVAAVTLSRGGGDDEGVTIRAAKVTRGSVTSRVRAQGKLRARRQAQVGSEVSGRVVAVFVEEGDTLKLGDPLFALDDEQQRNAVAQLEVGLRSARAIVDRAELVLAEAERGLLRDEHLRGRGAIPEEQLLTTRARVPLARADVESARATLDRARLDLARAKDALAKTRVTAPLAGTVVAVGLEVGQVVAPVGASLSGGLSSGLGGSGGVGLPAAGNVNAEIVVADLSELVAELDVDELDIVRVEVAQEVALRVQGDAREPLSAVVERAGLYGRDAGGAVVFPVVAAVARAPDPAGAATTLPVEGPPSVSRLRPGMTVTAEIEVERLDGALLIPLAAVLEADLAKGLTSDRVFVIEEVGERKVARSRDISLGPAEGEVVAVLGGLQAGEVLVEGPYRALRELRDDDPVRIEGDIVETRSASAVTAAAAPKDRGASSPGTP